MARNLVLFSPARRLAALVPLGRIFFASAIAFFGAQQLAFGDFVTRAMPPWPAWIPGRLFWPYVVGTAFVVCSAAILARREARRAALLLAALVLIGAVVLALPNVFTDVMLGGTWTLAGKAFVLGSGALLIAATLPVEAESPTDRLFVVISRVVLAGFLIQSGIQHFIWGDFVNSLVPMWIPGTAAFWTYFSAVALIAAGVGILIPRLARTAALLTAAMIFVWTLVLHLPRAVGDWPKPNESTAAFEALAITGLALILAAKWGDRRSAVAPLP